jgi:hypothetical protein
MPVVLKTITSNQLQLLFGQMDPNNKCLLKRLEQFRASKDDMYKLIEELDDRYDLAQGLTSANPIL